MRSQFKVSERRVCRVLGQHRSTQRQLPDGRADEERLVADMIELTRQYGRYGYRRIAALLRDAGWQVNDKRVERLWRREGLKVPMKQPKKGRLWLNDGSCVRLRPEYRNHVWSYDFVHHRTEDGRAFRTLNILDEHSRECLSIRVKRKLNSTEVIDALTDLFILRGVPVLMAVAVTWVALGSVLTGRTVELFISISMVLLGLQKLQDVERFATMFLNYDLLAQRWVRYGYVYPFVETGAGLLMLAGVLTWLSAPAALFVASIGAISVFKAVYIDKRDLKCACVGGDSKVPLGFVSLTENLMMIGMAIWMLSKL